ncbi:lysophospholipid acyltransferase family protein [Actinokineospora sp. NBRC 105648]|uniref:lysophospholipid acyltransferase family protein n=1 Tax=Actinokineospora sp. NBRC 105648 TaxID=3032206 RepID=UPI0024A3187C|nr:lysophospholipid acyltransferase family protein [Actinokineospora sp. NBRC 105648]GLZ40967.1 1-acyl-sn-glycerol-3-phosphate acyltransferase [Actinokineospora sp. NBRC 105648]
MSTWRAITLMFRVPRRGRGFWFSLAIDLIWPLLAVFTRLRFRGTLPKDRGVLLASNHLSFADPVTVTAFTLAAGRIPRYLAKASLWRTPVVGKVLKGGGHIPVERNTAQARDAYLGAVRAVQKGECVMFFPEAGFSDDGDHWPSRRVKNGVARVALETGAPVIPVVNWGTHLLLPATAKFPRLLPRKTVDIVAGEPVDLSDLAGTDRASIEEATKRIMHAVTELLATLRGEEPPAR